MDPIVLAAGTALVGAMATDAWQQARSSLVELWRRVRPEQAEVVDAELGDVRAQVLAARQAGEADTEQALVADWQLRIQALLRANPAVAVELRQLLDTQLAPALSADERSRIGTLVMRAEASGSGRVYQAGRDQHITER
ncbi:hypothetical protein [Streptomyces fulvoviolaceus]|uniref:hypothetical protein n=1 Tax=Streptomyces fulvoviolaceus TaxID=285535 RepID=UPI0021BF73BE|nr:hypothetical protein [Streptomyces fulvoviolaceus]MCT9084476.1 hypothetical protein [Streptomyces fulvoviolaceus]